MKYLAMAILLNSCAFNESTIDDVVEQQSQLQMKYAELDSKIDECMSDAKSAHDVSMINRQDILELQKTVYAPKKRRGKK